jgi:hypothetical protein
MNLSTSSSETASAGAWKNWLIACGAAFAATVAVVWAFLLLVDPYDTGRFSVLKQSEIFNRDPRTANASRGRNPLFNAALIGNSNGQALNPGRLSAATSLRFVQLTIPKTGPREQLTMLRWFISHHEQVGGVVVVADATWCTSDQTPPLAHPFPFWLYGSNIEYLRHIFTWHALELAFRRIRLILGLHEPTRPLDGFWDYEAERVWSFHPRPRPRDDDATATATTSTDVASAEISFPSIDQLDAVVAGLPPALVVVIVVPPVFSDAMPAARSPEAGRITQCKAALAKTVTERPRGGFLDFNFDNAMTRDPANFMDFTHYRAAVARQIEKSVAAVIGSAVASSSPGR